MSALLRVENSPDEVDLHVGRRLRAFRTSRRLSLEEVGRSVGVAYQQIQKYETGANRVSASMLWRLAKALDVDVGDFFPSHSGVQDVASIRAAASMARMDDGIRRTVGDLIGAVERRQGAAPRRAPPDPEARSGHPAP